MNDNLLKQINCELAHIRDLVKNVELYDSSGMPHNLCGACDHRKFAHVGRYYCEKKHIYEEFREKPTYKYSQTDMRSLIGLQIFDGKGCTDWDKGGGE
jgi:hypothetical protein